MDVSPKLQAQSMSPRKVVWFVVVVAIGDEVVDLACIVCPVGGVSVASSGVKPGAVVLFKHYRRLGDSYSCMAI